MEGGAAVPARGVSPPHLDTVRALHQTVVSLRTALEFSKNELKELREKYQRQSLNDYEDTINKLTLENHILRRRIIDSQGEDKFVVGDLTPSVPRIDVQSVSPRIDISSVSPADLPAIEPRVESTSASPVHEDVKPMVGTPSVSPVDLTEEEPAETGTIEVSSEELYDETIVVRETITEGHSSERREFCSTERLNKTVEIEQNTSDVQHFDDAARVDDTEGRSVLTDELLLSHPLEDDKKSTFRAKIELLSKFDVSIKVQTLEAGENFVSSTTSETESVIEFERNSTDIKVRETFHQERRSRQESTGGCGEGEGGMAERNTATGRADKTGVRVRVTSEDNLLLERTTQPNKNTLDLNVDNLSLRSMSEGDNSVFSECGEGAGGAPGQAPGGGERGSVGGEGSGDDSEEVDDIELIFTTDESKDMSNLQEDLVSIREGEPWMPSTPTKSTPVLIKFHTLDPEFHPHDTENQENAEQASGKKVRLAELEGSGKNTEQYERPGILKSCDNQSDNYSNKSGRRLQSTDSLSADHRGLSFDTSKSSSFELNSSLDMLQREESVDSFQQQRFLGHRFSVVGETDISKCGISEEDLSSANLNARRYTCPNPFQYRPLPHRPHTRQSGPFKATMSAGAGRSRPILKAENMSVRRENGAQTEVSALPPRWSSDGYLAHKVGPQPLATLPSRVTPPIHVSSTERPLRRQTACDIRPRTLAPTTLRTDEARRVMLSDIGFTSMVPELSRSADPVWAEGGGAVAACGACGATVRSPAASPTRHVTTGDTSRYLARGSYRSQFQSVDRNYDFSSSYVPPISSSTPKEYRSLWRSSLPDVRGRSAQPDSGDTDKLLDDADAFLRRSIDNLNPDTHYDRGDGYSACVGLSRPYIPSEPRHLRLGHTVKLITPHGRIAIGTVRYVGIAGPSGDSVVVGAVIPAHAAPTCVQLNDGTYGGRRYFRTPPGHTALFVPFSKVVMAWAV